MGHIVPAVKAQLGDFALSGRGSHWRVLGSRADVCHCLASIPKLIFFVVTTK